MRAAEFARRLIFALTLLLGTASCAHLASHKEKEISFQPFAALNIRGIAVGEFLRLRTAAIVAGARPRVLAIHDQTIDLELLPVSHHAFDVGFATCVAADGYYLTAAHCVPREPIYLLVPDGASARVQQGRVVWSPPAESACDLALVKIDASRLATFDAADLRQLRQNDDVVTIGYNGLAGGRILKVTDQFVPPSAQLPRVLAVYHTAPLTFGDSGGPLTTPDGKLIGIEVLAREDFLGTTEGIALTPDSTWLETTIARDRARGATTKP